MKIIKIPFILILILSLFSCNEDEILPKPKSFLRLEYPEVKYKKSATAPYEFETNNQAKIMVNSKNWMLIKYPKLKASIDITYRTLNNNNKKEVFKEANKLTLKHAPKADAIYSDIYENKEEHVYGKLNNVVGNAASTLQFQLTDSIKHFIVGSVYFDTAPNYDSLYPAIKYIEKDIRHLMSTTKWYKLKEEKLNTEDRRPMTDD